ncbi:MAG: hypothetical protein ACQKBT_05410 [Puniceicoccales bacterium]
MIDRPFFFWIRVLFSMSLTLSHGWGEEDLPAPPLTIDFELERAGYVTLVVEDGEGKRVRNLIAGEYFEAGSHQIPWDGQNEGRPIQLRGRPGYKIQREIVGAGDYHVRGLVRDEIQLSYEFSVYPNVSGAAWKVDGEKKQGGWLADHGNPHATLFIPAERAPDGVDTMLLTSTVAEAADGIAWVDLDGNKMAGQRWLAGVWTAASHLAYDSGDSAHEKIYAYGRMDWVSKQEGMKQLRISGFHEGRRDIGNRHRTQDYKVLWEDFSYSWNGGHPGDMAVHDSLLVFSVFGPGRIFFYDTSGVDKDHQATLLAEVPADEPNALAFDPQGRLLIINGDKLYRFTLQPFPDPLSRPELLIAEGLDEPRAMTVDRAGNIYIAEWGESHQIKVFDGQGKFLRSIGHPGGPVAGPYDPERMAFPYGMDVDSEGKLWVASRRWWLPKVVWVWDENGEHLRNHYGPTQYGGGGFLDPHDPTRLLYHNNHGGIEFRIDWAGGTAVPDSIYQMNYGARNDRWFEEALLLKERDMNPSYPYRARGNRYISNSFSGVATGPKMVFLLRDETPSECPPLLFLTTVGNYKKQLQELGLWETIPGIDAAHPAERFGAEQKTLCLWTDTSGDGSPQVEEFQIFLPRDLYDPDAPKMKFSSGAGIVDSIELGPDLDILVRFSSRSDKEPGGVLRFAPIEVKENGLPVYDPQKFEKVLEAPRVMRSSTNVHEFDDGGFVLTGGPIAGFDAQGEEQWIYHSQWASLHNGHAGPRAPEFSGQLIATLGMAGGSFTPQEGEAGPLWALNSNLGLLYLFTQDGLLVDTLFNYRDEGRLWNFLEAERGMDVTDANLGDETFYPSITQYEDGSVYMLAGKSSLNVIQLRGLDSIRRFQGSSFSISSEDVDRLNQYNLEVAKWRQDQEELGEILVRKMDNPQIDGVENDWGDPQWITIQEERVGSGFHGRDVPYTQAALAYDNQYLYVLMRSRDRRFLENAGASPEELFTTGGGLDLHLATRNTSGDRKNAEEGDVRLFIADVGKEFQAIRYRPVVPGTTDPVEYYSTAAETQIDRVDDVSESIKAAYGEAIVLNGKRKDKYYQVEVAIPIDLLGWDPVRQPVTIGDIGILAGDGGKTISRIYWYNKSTGLVSDAPTEARLQPSMWGPWKVEP